MAIINEGMKKTLVTILYNFIIISLKNKKHVIIKLNEDYSTESAIVVEILPFTSVLSIVFNA